MRRTPAPTSTATRSPRRLRPVLAMTALAALTLTACGTEKAAVGGPRSNPADTAGDRSGEAFAKMLSEVAQQCPPSAPPEAPPTGPARTLPSGATPPSDAIEPIAPTAGPEVELNARDWCASNLHEERVTQALWDLEDPTPAKVRAALNGLGYIDERIHGLERSGTATRFFLDLRERGGRLCLDGSAAGEETVVDKCVAPATGPFKAGERKV
ncbi:hypothetical protein ACFCYX_17975 [Streptomyces populi]|uniref:hypothetical protein n=1 Tax=Streptomyces populi TaxID=2058924 RepID=UPI001F0C7EC6|nr:hypothetical protein [Streptomyces populi]